MVHEKLVQPPYTDSVHLNPLSQAKRPRGKPQLAEGVEYQ